MNDGTTKSGAQWGGTFKTQAAAEKKMTRWLANVNDLRARKGLEPLAASAVKVIEVNGKFRVVSV